MKKGKFLSRIQFIHGRWSQNTTCIDRTAKHGDGSCLYIDRVCRSVTIRDGDTTRRQEVDKFRAIYRVAARNPENLTRRTIGFQ